MKSHQSASWKCPIFVSCELMLHKTLRIKIMLHRKIHILSWYWSPNLRNQHQISNYDTFKKYCYFIRPIESHLHHHHRRHWSRSIIGHRHIIHCFIILHLNKIWLIYSCVKCIVKSVLTFLFLEVTVTPTVSTAQSWP